MSRKLLVYCSGDNYAGIPQGVISELATLGNPKAAHFLEKGRTAHPMRGESIADFCERDDPQLAHAIGLWAASIQVRNKAGDLVQGDLEWALPYLKLRVVEVPAGPIRLRWSPRGEVVDYVKGGEILTLDPHSDPYAPAF